MAVTALGPIILWTILSSSSNVCEEYMQICHNSQMWHILLTFRRIVDTNVFVTASVQDYHNSENLRCHVWAGVMGARIWMKGLTYTWWSDLFLSITWEQTPRPGHIHHTVENSFCTDNSTAKSIFLDTGISKLNRSDHWCVFNLN